MSTDPEALKPKFGDIIENGWASESNPTRTGFFVREGRRTGKMNPGRYFEVTDGAGMFWELIPTGEHKITVRPGPFRNPAPRVEREDVSEAMLVAAWSAYNDEMLTGSHLARFAIEQAVKAAVAMLPQKEGWRPEPDDEFRGDTPDLIKCIRTFLAMDAERTLVPHGVGGHARTLLSAAAVRLAQPERS